MGRKLALWLIWTVFTAYTLLLAPLDQPGTMCVVFPSLLGDDMARRGLWDSRIFWAVSLVPLFGALAYLCFRPPLPESNASIVNP